MFCAPESQSTHGFEGRRRNWGVESFMTLSLRSIVSSPTSLNYICDRLPADDGNGLHSCGQAVDNPIGSTHTHNIRYGNQASWRNMILRWYRHHKSPYRTCMYECIRRAVTVVKRSDVFSLFHSLNSWDAIERVRFKCDVTRENDAPKPAHEIRFPEMLTLFCSYAWWPWILPSYASRI